MEDKHVDSLVQEIHRLKQENALWQQYTDFSQLGEERVIINILERMFSKCRLDRFYLDIGGYHPTDGSNTFKLYLNGWSGIIVEPNLHKTANWKSLRPRDHVINSALIPETWELEAVLMQCADVNDARESLIDSLNPRARTKCGNSTYEVGTIKLMDLYDLSAEMGLRPTFVSIDIEGLEEKIILESDLSKLEIPILCVEHFLNEFTKGQSIFEYQNSKLVKKLIDSGYYLVSVCGVSLIFAHQKYFSPYE